MNKDTKYEIKRRFVYCGEDCRWSEAAATDEFIFRASVYVLCTTIVCVIWVHRMNYLDNI